ncbi:DUF7504 family protein [Halosegnis marinus]|uniref:KaiC-like domain-containing protein n=1 Tax=Halosegnis marinus TaxID=3034023 RepID=A0ABD5ZP38_9EURY|nr:hypothetical protein [Halosegnis sp. DT85]
MTDAPPLVDVLDSARSVLVLAGGLSDAKDAACASLLARDAPAETTALAVSYDRSGGEWLAHAESAMGGEPAEALVVDASGTGEGGDRVTTTGPDDLTGMQIALSEAFPIAGTGVFCFDSFTTLLQYIDEADAYRFCNELLGRLWDAGVNVHVHLDPAATDADTVRSLASLFDAVVAADAGAIPAPTDPAVADGREVAVATRSRGEGND